MATLNNVGTESETQLNPGSGGDYVRDYLLTNPDGTTAKQQAVTVADPLTGTPQRVTAAGEGVVDMDGLVPLMAGMLKTLRKIEWIMTEAFGVAGVGEMEDPDSGIEEL